jgi:sugar (pentulose or hexulose) kinase
MCGAVGAGLYADLSKAMDGMSKNYDQFQPNKGNHDLYEALRGKIIQKLYPALENILKDLAELTTNKQ